MANVSRESITSELSDLRQLLTDTVPSYERTRQTVSMPTGASPLIARCWETIGWLSDFEDVLVRPDDAHALAQMAALIDEWRMDDPRGDGSYDHILDQLPAKYRVVAIGDEHLTIADETDAAEDPPLCVVYGPSTDVDDRLVEPLGSTYLAGVASAILESVRLATRWNGSLIASLSALDDVFRCLMPGSKRSGSCWLLAQERQSRLPANPAAETVDQPDEPAHFDVRAPSLSALVALFDRLAGERLTGWTAHVAPARRARRVPLPKTLRRWTLEQPFEHELYVGSLEGVPVIVVEPADPRELVAVHCEVADLPAVDRWFATHRPTAR